MPLAPTEQKKWKNSHRSRMLAGRWAESMSKTDRAEIK